MVRDGAELGVFEVRSERVRGRSSGSNREAREYYVEAQCE